MANIGSESSPECSNCSNAFEMTNSTTEKGKGRK